MEEIKKEERVNYKMAKIKEERQQKEKEEQEIKQQKIKKIKKRVQIGERAFKGASKSVKFSKKLSSSLLGYANAFGGSSSPQGQKQSGPGRPQGVMKHRSPFTGKPIPAPLFYKEMRAFRRIQEQRANGVQTQQLQQMAKRGVPPSQIQTIQQRMNQQRLLDQSQNQMNQRQMQNQQRVILPNQQINPQVNPNQIDINQLPNGTIIPTGNKIWRFERGQVGTEGGLFGTVKKIYGQESSFWN